MLLLRNTRLEEDFPGGPVVKTLSSEALGAGLIPGWEAKVLHASWPKKQKHKQYCNKFNKDLKRNTRFKVLVFMKACVKYGDKIIGNNELFCCQAVEISNQCELNLERNINLLVNEQVDMLKIEFLNRFQKFVRVHPKDKISVQNSQILQFMYYL